MISLKEVELEQVQDMAYYLIEPKLIAINLGIDEIEFLAQLNSENPNPIKNAFYVGYLKQLMELRIALVKASNNGSNPAQEQLLMAMKGLNNVLE